MPDLSGIGIVAIGRNEGERLQRCLRSIPAGLATVYVDSASSDGSAEFARDRGDDVVELDISRPFTAARARNEGFARLIARHPDLEFVQFVDGDCEFETGWIEQASAFLLENPRAAAVCGRRRERYPERSFYNRLCDDEWNTPIGEAAACGGDVLLRRAPFEEIGQYDSVMIAGEEPEMCQRLRAAGWKVWRIAAPMTIHDADMHRFRAWWLRAVRSGYGYAQVWHQTSQRGNDRLYGRELMRALVWAIGVPVLALLLAFLLGPTGLIALPVSWAAQYLRLAIKHGWRKGGLLLVAKAAEAKGAVQFMLAALRGRKQGAIFYK